MAVMNGNKLKPPRPDKYVVKNRDPHGNQVWREFDDKVAALAFDLLLTKQRQQSMAPELNPKCTLRELWDSYEAHLKELIENGLRKHSTLSVMRRRLETHVFPDLAHIRTTRILRQHLRALIKKLLATPARANTRKPLTRLLSKRTVEAIIRTVSALLSYAVKQDVLQFNPAHGLGLEDGLGKTKEEQTEEVDKEKALTRKEKARFLEIAGGICSPLMYCLFAVLLETGMRIGEAMALRWADLDLTGEEADDGQATIHVQRNYDHENKTLDLPKSNLRRRVDVNEDLLPVLLAYQGSEPRNPDDLVFPPQYAKSGFLHYSTVDNWLRKICRHADITRHFTPHYLRHTFASILITMPDVEIKYIARQLGHTEPQITRLYTQWLPIRCEAAVRSKPGSKLNAKVASTDKCARIGTVQSHT